MAKQIIILGVQLDATGEIITVNFLLWSPVLAGNVATAKDQNTKKLTVALAPTTSIELSPIIDIPAIVSKWTGASDDENTAIANGLVAEEECNVSFPSSVNWTDIKNKLVAFSINRQKFWYSSVIGAVYDEKGWSI